MSEEQSMRSINAHNGQTSNIDDGQVGMSSYMVDQEERVNRFMAEWKMDRLDGAIEENSRGVQDREDLVRRVMEEGRELKHNEIVEEKYKKWTDSGSGKRFIYNPAYHKIVGVFKMVDSTETGGEIQTKINTARSGFKYEFKSGPDSQVVITSSDNNDLTPEDNLKRDYRLPLEERGEDFDGDYDDEGDEEERDMNDDDSIKEECLEGTVMRRIRQSDFKPHNDREGEGERKSEEKKVISKKIDFARSDENVAFNKSGIIAQDIMKYHTTYDDKQEGEGNGQQVGSDNSSRQPRLAVRRNEHTNESTVQTKLDIEVFNSHQTFMKTETGLMFATQGEDEGTSKMGSSVKQSRQETYQRDPQRISEEGFIGNEEFDDGERDHEDEENVYVRSNNVGRVDSVHSNSRYDRVDDELEEDEEEEEVHYDMKRSKIYELKPLSPRVCDKYMEETQCQQLEGESGNRDLHHTQGGSFKLKTSNADLHRLISNIEIDRINSSTVEYNVNFISIHKTDCRDMQADMENGGVPYKRIYTGEKRVNNDILIREESNGRSHDKAVHSNGDNSGIQNNEIIWQVMSCFQLAEPSLTSSSMRKRTDIYRSQGLDPLNEFEHKNSNDKECLRVVVDNPSNHTNSRLHDPLVVALLPNTVYIPPETIEKIL